MAAREVSLFLKYPGPPVLRQRLQHSRLECIVEYKTASDAAELQSRRPSLLHSEYQLNAATVTMCEDEIVIQFVPKNSGLHTARIFGDTKELCRPVAFVVTPRCEVENITSDQPLSPAIAALLIPDPVEPPPVVRSPSPPAPQAQAAAITQQHEQRKLSQATQDQQQQFASLVQSSAEPSELSPSPPPLTPPHPQRYLSDTTLVQQQNQAASQEGLYAPASSRPLEPDEAYTGDLFSSKKSGRNTFDELYAIKQDSAGFGSGTINHNSAITPETLALLKKGIDSQVSSYYKGDKSKRSCGICSKSVKLSKVMQLLDGAYCEACFRRQFILKGSIEHFMTPVVTECVVDVPVNKKRNKFVAVKMTMPQVNLRGLEISDVRLAQAEFNKFDVEGEGWINKAVLLPLLKACFTASMSDMEIKSILSSQVFQSTMQSYGINERSKIHQIEFLALMAFITRESMRLRGANNPQSKFTRNDLDMAYAFRNQFSGNPQQQAKKPGTESVRYTDGSQQQKYTNPLLNKSPTDSAIEAMVSSPLQKAPTQKKAEQLASSMRAATPQPHPSVSYDVPRRMKMPESSFWTTPNKLPHFSSMGLSQSTNIPAGYGLRGFSRRNTKELPEVDQDESEMQLPRLPPEKDPSAQKTGNPLPSKNTAKAKQLMETFKLTGRSTDGWMMY